jgi:hypothetical protein
MQTVVQWRKSKKSLRMGSSGVFLQPSLSAICPHVLFLAILFHSEHRLYPVLLKSPSWLGNWTGFVNGLDWRSYIVTFPLGHRVPLYPSRMRWPDGLSNCKTKFFVWITDMITSLYCTLPPSDTKILRRLTWPKSHRHIVGKAQLAWCNGSVQHLAWRRFEFMKPRIRIHISCPVVLPSTSYAVFFFTSSQPRVAWLQYLHEPRFSTYGRGVVLKNISAIQQTSRPSKAWGCQLEGTYAPSAEIPMGIGIWWSKTRAFLMFGR